MTWPQRYGGPRRNPVAVGGVRGGVLPRRSAWQSSANGTSMLARHCSGTAPNSVCGSCRKWPAARRSGRRPGRNPESGSDLTGGPPRRRPTAVGCSTARRSGVQSRALRGSGVRVVRSDPTSQRHRGLTYLMFDLKADGVTVRPIDQLGGATGFGEIFLDDVFVPGRRRDR